MIPFRPVIEPKHEEAFLIEDPLISVRKGRLLDIPWMTGITSEEGSLKVPGRGNMLEFRLNSIRSKSMTILRFRFLEYRSPKNPSVKNIILNPIKSPLFLLNSK